MDERGSPSPSSQTARRVIFWVVGTLVVLMVMWGALWLAVPLRTRSVLLDALNHPTGGGTNHAVQRLGGPQKAMARIMSFLDMPKPIARTPLKTYAAMVLGDCGKEAIPLQLKLMQDRNPAIRSGALAGLMAQRKRMGPSAQAANDPDLPAVLSAVKQAMADRDVEVSGSAAAIYERFFKDVDVERSGSPIRGSVKQEK